MSQSAGVIEDMAARPAIGSAATTMRLARCAVDCRDRRPRKTVRRLCGVL